MTLIFGGLALVLALVFGGLSWRQRMGKAVAIATLVLAAGLGIAALALVWTPPWTRRTAEQEKALALWETWKLSRHDDRFNSPTNVVVIPGALVRNHPFGTVQLVAVDYDPPTDGTWPTHPQLNFRPTGIASPQGILGAPKGQKRLVGVALKLTSNGSFGQPSIPQIRFASGPTSGQIYQTYKEGGWATQLTSSTTPISLESLEIGVADGPWETIHSVGIRSGRVQTDDSTGPILDPDEAEGWQTWSTPGATNEETRLLFHFRNGEKRPSRGEIAKPGASTISGQIPTLLKNQLVRIEIQRRPIQWV